AEKQVLGGTGLHPRAEEDTREIGYWVHAHHVRQGIATEATTALVKVGFELYELRRIDIQCDPKNVASAAIPRKLGFVHEATLRERALPGAEPSDKMFWTMLTSEYPKSFAFTAPLQAFDAIGKLVLNS